MGNIVVSKEAKPVVSNIVHRERLFTLMDNSLINQPVLWVSSPAGSGKTTLVSDYLASKKRDSLWYQVSGSDDDLSSFYYRFGEAAKRTFPKMDTQLPALTAEYNADIPTFSLRYFEQFYKAVDAPFTIVLDNYQEISTPSLHGILARTFSEIPNGVNVIVVSRKEPQPDFSRLKADNMLGKLDWGDIRFTVDEARGVLEGLSQMKISGNLLDAVYKVSDGWVSSLILLAEKARQDSIDIQSLSGLISNDIFDYFSNELFEKADSTTQEFLLKTSYLPFITETLAEDLTGIKNSGLVLAKLVARHFFIQEYHHAETAYQYHALFGEFLQSRAKSVLNAVQVREIRETAAQLMEKSGNVEEAIAIFIDIADWARAIPLVLGQAQGFMARGRIKTLGGFLQAIPDSIVQSEPWLSFWQGVCLFYSNPNDAVVIFERTVKEFNERSDTMGAYLSWSGLVECHIFLSLSYKPLDDCLVVLDELEEKYPEYPSIDIESRVVLGRFASYILRNADYSKREALSKRAFVLMETCSDINTRQLLGLYLSFYYDWLGEFNKDKQHLAKLRKDADADKANTPWKIALSVMESGTLWMVGEFEQSLHLAEEGLKLAKHSGMHRFTFLLTVCAARASLCLGDFETADGLIKEMEPHLWMISNLDKLNYYFIISYRAFLKDDYSLALKHFEVGKLSNDILGSVMHESTMHLSLAIIQIKTGDIGEALKSLTHAKEINLRFKSLLQEYTYLLISAYVSFKQGEQEKGLQHLQKAMELGAEQDYMYFMYYDHDIMSLCCFKAIEYAMETDYVKRIIKKRNIVPQAPIDNWPYPIKFHTLGRFEISVDDKPVAFTGKVQKKPLAMLKALISFGGSKIGVEQMSDALWPDADGDAAKISFNTTLHRLRQLLSKDMETIKLEEGYISLNPDYCWVDAFQLEDTMSKISPLLKSKADMNELETLIDKSLKLYKGDFLPADQSEPWSVHMREKLKEGILNNIIKVGSLLESQGDCDKAIEYYRRIIDIDDIYEEPYLRMMICYKNNDRKTEAVAVYNQCRNILVKGHNVDLSPEIESIYKSLYSAGTL